MKRYLKRTIVYSPGRWLLRQFVREPHYPPPLWERAFCAPFSAVEKRLYAHGRLSRRELVLPTFLGLGAMHSGTSWIWEHLRRLPEVYIPPEKELHYFSWGFHRGLRSYSRRLAPGAGKVVGEITTEYASLPPHRIQFVRGILPDVRLFIILRDPIDRAWSHAKQELMYRPGRRYADVRPSEFLRHFRSARSRGGGDYLRAIDSWLSVFPPEQLYVGFFDDIERCPQRMLDGVLRHIGVSPGLQADPPALCGGQRPQLAPGESPHDLGRWTDYCAAPVPPEYRDVLASIYASDIDALYERFGARVGAWRCR